MDSISSSNRPEAFQVKKERRNRADDHAFKQTNTLKNRVKYIREQGRRIIIQDQVFDYFVIFQVQTFVSSIFCTFLADQNIPSFPLNAF